MREAIRRVTARPQLLLAVAGLHVAVALLASGPVSATLQPLLDGRPAAAGLVRGDDGLAGELFSDHPEILRVAGASAEWSALFYALLSWILVGGLLSALASDDDEHVRGPVAVAAACARHAGRMVRVGLVGLPLRLLPMAIAAGAWFAVGHFTKGRGFAELVLGAAVLALVFGGAWSFITVSIDYARGLAFADAGLKPWRAVGRGFTFALRRFAATTKLAAFSGFGFALSTGAYLAVALALPNEPAWAFVALTLLRLGLVLARAFFTVSTLTAAALAVRTAAQ
ncbi:MAG TPA: hypothetical protein VFF06_17965 [Polyangia bacterium]|nr:hypothetical protein [Polyangia bacterium]